MRAFLIALLVWMACASTPAQAGRPLHGAGNAPCVGDGSVGGPTGAAQFAGLLAAVPFPPTCAVAGVSYRVGPSATQSYANPSTLGAAWDATNRRFRCDGTNGYVVDGIDFTEGGTTGAAIYITGGCNNLTLKNFKIKAFWGVNGVDPGGCSFAIQQDPGNSGLTILNADIDGNGITAETNCGAAPAGTGELLYLRGEGSKTLDYVYIHDAPQHFVTWGGPSSGALTSAPVITHSVITRCGFGQGEHCNGLEWTGAITTSSSVQWNLFYDPQPDVASGSLSVTYTNASATFHLSGTAGSFRAGNTLTGSCITGTATVLSVGGAGNLDITTDKTATCSGAGTVNSPNMYPIGLTIPVRYVNDGGASVLLNATISHDTFYGPGPIFGATYSINCAGIDGLVANDNHYMPANNSGGLYTGAGCTAVSGTGNTRMNTGATVAIP